MAWQVTVIPVTAGSGLNLDATKVITASGTVYREVTVIGDPEFPNDLARVTTLGSMQVAETGAPNTSGGQVLCDTGTDQIVPIRSTRRSVLLVNGSNVDVYIGNSNVTPTTGVLLLGVKGAGLTINTTSAVYGVTLAGSTIVSFMETYD